MLKVVSSENIETKVGTYLVYCPAGRGKTTAIGKNAEKMFKKTGKRTLVLDVDRTTRVLKDVKGIDIFYIDNKSKGNNNDGTWESWHKTLSQIDELISQKKFDYGLICVDNVSELERCILSDLGSQGKNKGVPEQRDYQYMQFKLVNSLRFMKGWDVALMWTAWEELSEFVNPNGTKYTERRPKINHKIVDNICGLCDCVANIVMKEDGTRGMILESMQNIYAKNQMDDRNGCLVQDLIKL